MNILNEYIKKEDERIEKYAYILINLYDYARLGELDISKSLTEKEKLEWKNKALEYRKEIIELIKKGKRL